MPDTLESHLLRQLEGGGDYFWHRLRHAVIQKHLPRERPFTLLDVGAGAGLLGAYLNVRAPNASYRFVEQIPSLRASLRERYGIASDLSQSASFDGAEVITLLDVLEHQAEDASFLRELTSKMQVGATLIITVPALPILWSSWDVGLGHFRRYTLGAMRELLRALPVEIIELTYLFPEMVPLGLWRRLRRPPHRQIVRQSELELPRLSNWVNEMAYRVGMIGLLGRRLNLFGSSVLAVVQKRASCG